jgi:hypothetical protein
MCAVVAKRANDEIIKTIAIHIPTLARPHRRGHRSHRPEFLKPCCGVRVLQIDICDV